MLPKCPRQELISAVQPKDHWYCYQEQGMRAYSLQLVVLRVFKFHIGIWRKETRLPKPQHATKPADDANLCKNR